MRKHLHSQGSVIPAKAGIHRRASARQKSQTAVQSETSLDSYACYHSRWLPALAGMTTALLLLTTACAVGPDYVKPPVETPAAFKESGEWKQAAPQDAIDRGEWWKIYHDPILNALESQIDISNQNLKQAEASYRSAVALADQTRSGLFPTVAAEKSATRTGVGAHTAANTYDLSASASWSLDVWGKIRRALESQEASAQASAADIASARLSAQAELATDYFALRVQDELQRLLNKTVADDRKILTIVQNEYKAGVAAQSDVLAAQTEWENARATATGAGVKRAQLEHAIAVLTGRPPAAFALAPSDKIAAVPMIPASVPSVLLQRRPDIASAERQMAAANAQIGVAVAAYYPDLTLSASYGFTSNVLNNLFNAASSLWSFGGSASETLIDFGARDAATEEARANFDASTASYRQTVLTAFQNVEDNLAAQRILADQEKAQTAATSSARKSEQVTVNQYKQGIVPYNAVLSAQITRLNDEQSSLTVQSNRLAASVSLIEALGGGWDAKQLLK
ncbi:MAG: efflux transporter outer membrane subunit [Alphaproteobacteria bacterium]|nr:efflux transporter outer membrane subunit [Alphaproteobacteria bacterium]